MRLKELQKTVDEWINNIGVRYFNELTNTVILSEEVGEFSSIMAREYGEQSYKDPSNKAKAKSRLKEELADILFVITCLANQLDIDLEEAMEENLEKKTKRDNTRHSDNEKLK